MKTISSAANPLVKDIKALALKKNRTAQNLFYAEGLQIIGMAQDCGWSPEVLLLTDEGARHKVAKSVLHDLHADHAYLVTPQILSRISARDNPPPALATYKTRWTKLDAVKLGHEDVWIVLEGIKDPGNLGTIIRTADAAGAKGIILVGDTCDPYSVEAVRASMGSVFALALVETKGPQLLAWLKAQRAQIVGTALQTDKDWQAVTYATPLVLCMGNEQSGLSPALREACTDLVKLPMRGTAESLNLAVCTGIMLYKVLG